MADNLKTTEQNINSAINPSSGIGGITADAHNDVLKQVLKKTGKYSGFPYLSQRDIDPDGVVPIGTFVWNNNAFNNTDNFTITLSYKNTDLNDVGVILDIITLDSLIHFKDYVGRSCYLKYVSHVESSDTSGNKIYNITVSGFTSNINYTYQLEEQEQCIIDFYIKPSGSIDLSNILTVSDKNDVPQFNLGLNDVLQFEGGVFDPVNKKFSVSVMKFNTLFIKSSGDDLTAEPNNLDKPFDTFDGAVQYLLDNTDLGKGWFIEFTDGGTYTYTLENKTLKGFNIRNLSGAILNIQQGIYISEQWFWYSINGQINFEKTDSTIAINNSFVDGSAEINHYVYEVNIKNSETAPSNLSRGIVRSFGNVISFYWSNLNFQDNTSSITGRGAISGDALRFGTITNNCNSTSYGSARYIFTSISGSDYNVEIDKYINNSNIIHEIVAEKLKINTVESPNAITKIQTQSFVLTKDIVFQNTCFIPSLSTGYYQKVVINGNGFKLTLNNTISLGLLFGEANASKTTNTGYEKEKYTLIKDLVVNIPTGSLVPYIAFSDLRAGRFGRQTILDNFEMIADTIPLLQISNSNNSLSDYQIVFRNAIKILNNTYLEIGAVGTGNPSTVIVSEGANIIHDFAQISADADFQTTITNINTY